MHFHPLSTFAFYGVVLICVCSLIKLAVSPEISPVVLMISNYNDHEDYEKFEVSAATVHVRSVFAECLRNGFTQGMTAVILILPVRSG